jgi:hypothetical protein
MSATKKTTRTVATLILTVGIALGCFGARTNRRTNLKAPVTMTASN